MTKETRFHVWGIRETRRKPKLQIHEHLDCSVRPRFMLERWEQLGFDNANIAFPDDVLTPWKRANQVTGLERRRLRAQAVSAYRQFLVRFASESLANYVQAVVDHVLPVMQTRKDLYRITQDRIRDAVVDGMIAMELRFAPQLHTMKGLTLDEVMEPVIKAIDASPIPIRLIVCALRHEDADMARQLGDLCLRYRDHVGVFDLAADEEANPGVLDWWLKEALRVREESDGEILLDIHLNETTDPTERDKRLIRKHGITRIGHGIRGDWEQFLEVCPTSNVVTGQVASYGDHPIDRFLREGKLVTVNTDGTLFTEVQLSDEYRRLQEHFGWGDSEFLTVNLNAVDASSFSDNVKARLRRTLQKGYSR